MKRFVQSRPAQGTAVFPLSACCSWFIPFLERPGMFKVGNKFWRRGRYPEGRGAVRCFILLMKRRSNLRTALIGVGGATTTSVSKRGAAREQLRLAAKAAEGDGARFGRGAIKTSQSSPELPGTFAVHPRRRPQGDCTNAAPNLTSRRRSRRRACLLEVTRRPFCFFGFPR